MNENPYYNVVILAQFKTTTTTMLKVQRRLAYLVKPYIYMNMNEFKRLQSTCTDIYMPGGS